MKFSNLTRIYTNGRIIKNQTITLDEEIFYYCKTVLRMRVGEEFRLFNQIDGEFIVKVAEISKRNLQIIIVDKLREVVHEKALILGLCIIKADRFIEAVKAAVQLGVMEIIPIISERTQTKAINHERITKCIVESVEQSERFILPLLHTPITLDKFCDLELIEQIIFANEEEKSLTVNSIKQMKEKLAVLIGPEGGFSAEEKQMLVVNGKVQSVTLGSTVLKSEVAAVALIASVNLIRNK